MRDAEPERFLELHGTPLAGAPIENFALGDEVVHRAAGFKDRRRGIGAVAIEEVKIVNLQAGEGGVAGLEEVLAGEAGLVGLLVFAAEVGFARNKVAAAAPTGFFQNCAHDNLGLAGGVDLGVVEKIDAGVVGGVEELLGDGIADLLTKGDPSTEGERGNLQAGAAEVAVNHVRIR